MSSALLSRPLLEFWAEDLPPMSGALRIAVYGGMMILFILSQGNSIFAGMNSSPWNAPALYKFTSRSGFYKPEGLAKLLTPILSVRLVYFVWQVCKIAWICCIVGFGGCWPSAIFGITTFFLFSVCMGCIGPSHRWLLPSMVLLVLALTPAHHELSLDVFLNSKFSNYPFPPVRTPLQSSAVSRTFTLVMGMSTLWNGGVAKMKTSGLKWMNGKSLAYYAGRDVKKGQQNGSFILFRNLIRDVPIFAALLATGSILLEFGSVAAIFLPVTRPLIIASATLFHIGIWFTMTPNYFPQCLCYTLCVRWPGETNASVLPALLDKTDTSLLIGIYVVFFACVAEYIAGLLSIEYWPITCIPMYAFYRDETYEPDYFLDINQAQVCGKDFVKSGIQSVIGWADNWVYLRLANNNQELDLGPYVCNSKAAHGAFWKQYRVVLAKPIAVDLNYLPATDAAAVANYSQSEKSKTTKLVNKTKPYLKNLLNDKLPEWTKNDNVLLQACVRTKAGSVVFGSAKWN